MPGGITLSVKPTGADIARVIKTYTRRATAQRLHVAGNQALSRAQFLAGSELEVRERDRRREPGSIHYVNAFDATYIGLEEFGSSAEVVRLSNSSPNAARIEYGTSAHEIAPDNAARLAWPGTVLPPGVSVWHPGTAARGIIRRSLAGGLKQAFPGVAFGNLTFNE